MRKVVLAMNTAINGRVDDPYTWCVDLTDDHYTVIDQGYATFDTILVGRVTYDEMFAYWPGAESEEGGSEINKRMARKMNSYRKVVISRDGEPGPLPWNNAELVNVASDDDLVALVGRLKSEDGADIHLAGGARLAQTITRLGLVDEFRVFVHPVVSAGETWSDQVPDTPRHGAGRFASVRERRGRAVLPADRRW